MTTLIIALALVFVLLPLSLAYNWLTNPEAHVPDRGAHAAHTPWMTNGERLWHDLTHKRPVRTSKLHAQVTSWVPEVEALPVPQQPTLRMTRSLTTGAYAWASI